MLKFLGNTAHQYRKCDVLAVPAVARRRFGGEKGRHTMFSRLATVLIEARHTKYMLPFLILVCSNTCMQASQHALER